MKKLRVGVIGIGDISNVYLNNLKKYDAVEVVACASRGLEKAQRKAAEHGIPKAYASGMELIADPDIDIILNLTTPQAHYEYNLAALKAGKHVYTEKPLAMTFEQGRELVSLAKEKGLLIGCAPDTFLGGRLQNIRELIDSGRLGRITGGGAWFVGHGHEFHHPAPAFFYQPGAGPLYDMGPYYVTALLSLLGPVKRVCAMATKAGETRTVPSGPSKGHGAAGGRGYSYQRDSRVRAAGAQVTLTCSFDVWDSELPRMEIYGTEGTVLIDEKDPISGPEPVRRRYAHAHARPVPLGGCRTPSGERKRAVAGRAEQPSVQFGQPRREPARYRSGGSRLRARGGPQAVCLRRDGAAFA